MADSNSLNSFTFIGFVGQDAKGFTSKKTSRKFVVVDICTQEKYRNKPDPKIVWHKVQIWGTKMAPWAEGAIKKGMMVLAKGRIDYHFIRDQGGYKQMVTDFKVEELVTLRSKKIEDPAPAQATETRVQTTPIPAAGFTPAPVEEDPY